MLPVPLTLGYFGKGSFKLLRADQQPEAGSIPFTLTSHKDLIMINGTLMTLGDAIAKQRVTDVTARISYHEMIPVDGSPGEFTVKCIHHVWFTKKPDSEGTAAAAAHTHLSIASVLDHNEWNTRASKLVWVVRWTAKGLMPVKAAAVLTQSGKLATGRAVKLLP